MLSSYECALFSELCYYKKTEIESRLHSSFPAWRLLEISPLSDTGTKCLAFINEALQQVVIAVRGSHVLENWVTNFTALAPGLFPHCYAEIRDFINRFKEMDELAGYGFTCTGHSLGAYLAELYVCEHGGNAITFESPGCKEIAERLGFDFSACSIITYLSAPNVVNTLYGHIGEIRRIYVHHTAIHGTGDDSGIDDVGGYSGVLAGLVTGKSFFAALSTLFDLSYLKRIHSMVHILDCFDMHTGEPELYRKVFYWPSQNDYLNWISVDFSSITIKSFLSKKHVINQAIESQLSFLRNYVIGSCCIPDNLSKLSDRNKQIYAGKALNRFDDFFWDLTERTDFLLALGYRGSTLHLSRHLGSHNMGKMKQIGVVVGSGLIGAEAGTAVAGIGAASGAGGAIATTYSAGGFFAAAKATSVAACTLNPVGLAVGGAIGVVSGLAYCLSEANAEHSREIARSNSLATALARANQIVVGETARAELADKRTDKMEEKLKKVITKLGMESDSESDEDSVAATPVLKHHRAPAPKYQGKRAAEFFGSAAKRVAVSADNAAPRSRRHHR